MIEIDFSKIASRGGSVENAFEALCCQLASRTRPPGTRFERYRGAGGDGGVECKVVDSSGAATGWQTKYVFEFDKLIKQVKLSLEVALSVHADITHYVVCFPFDLTGKTARKGKNQTEKFDKWARTVESDAKAKGRILTIDRWSAHEITDLILTNDSSGGLRHYYFSSTIFSGQWFTDHVASAKLKAGPRYNREISLETPLSKWFSSFCGEMEWQAQLTVHLKACREETSRIERYVTKKSRDSALPDWPEASREAGQKVIEGSRSCLQCAEGLLDSPTEEGLSTLQTSIAGLLSGLNAVENVLATELNAKHGEGTADSKRFRAYMAEYMVSFPAANLDAVRDALVKWREFSNWLCSPAGFLAFRRVFVLSGVGGAGKTHSLCDIAQHRMEDGFYTCLVFGHQFSGEPDPWTRFAESIGAPLTLGRDGMLDALDAAGECSGKILVICIDAINETRPRHYWLDRIVEIADQITSRAHLKFCISCRTSFLRACLPIYFVEQAIEHKGFTGMEREACSSFFSYFGLEPPLVPVLQPELANPLYLKLVCETLQAKGLKQLPKGWFGIAPVIRAFLEHKEDQFAAEHGISPGAAIVSGSLRAIATKIAQSGDITLSWSEAQSVIESSKPQAKKFNVLQWLVTADLLIEDGPPIDALGAENVVRPAFERFGDFLVASEMLNPVTSSSIRQAFSGDGQFAHLLKSTQVIGENAGLLSALSVLISEKFAGIEFTDFIEDDSIRDEIADIVVSSLAWRTPETFSASTQYILGSMLYTQKAYNAVDTILAIATQDSVIDAFWLNEILVDLPFAMRDAFWCTYLKLGFERNNIVRHMIEASKDINLKNVDVSTAERWCIILVWFCAAADRRVKDFSTRAAVAVLRFHVHLLPKLVNMFLATDDDEVRERVLLIAYGTLIQSHDKDVLREVAEELLTTYAARPEDFQNAIIRDHIRCIADLAAHLGCLDKKFDPTLPSQRNPEIHAPVEPGESEEQVWKKEEDAGVRLLVRSCLDDDFNHYSIGCLREWNHVMLKPAIGRWIAKIVLDDFNYRDSGCSNYDSAVTQETGGGRSKPSWAERIGKKYQWVAMYQLASLLHDSVDREKDSWVRTTGLLPLVLQEERKLDPTINCPKRPERTPSECWWIGGNVNLPLTAHLDFATWVKRRDDIPLMESLLTLQFRNGQRWIPLVCSPTWSEYRDDRPHGEPYRQAWIHIEALLVRNEHFDQSVRALSRRNFFGKWMPEGAHWLHVFVGEYPWGAACNVETDDYQGFKSNVNGSSLEFIPVSNGVHCEWQYDGSLPKSIYFNVPARVFFAANQLWWNGEDGFSNPEAKTVFRDPSATEGGPGALVADIDDLLPRLKNIGYRLIWTLLGEKRILSEKLERPCHVTFSQIAYLNEDGSIHIGDRVFFDDYEKNIGLTT